MDGIGDGKDTYYRVEGSYPDIHYLKQADDRIELIAERYGSHIDSSGMGFGMRDVCVRFRTFIEALAFADDVSALGIDYIYDITWDDWSRDQVDDFIRLTSSKHAVM
jgi:hypothetical protein